MQFKQSRPKIQTLQENSDDYIKMNGQRAYNEMLAGLVSRMTQMGDEEVRETTTPVSVGYSLLSDQSSEQAIETENE